MENLYKCSNYVSSSQYCRTNSSITSPTLTFLSLNSVILLLVSGDTERETWALFLSSDNFFLPESALFPPQLIISPP